MKVCLITGAGRGIGAATAVKFAEMGYSVIINYNRSREAAESLRDALRAQGHDAHAVQADVSDMCSIGNMFDWVGRYFKHIDVLVNNAGIALTAQLQDVTERQFDEVMYNNVKSAFFCCQKALPFLSRCGGSIVNVGSIWGIQGSSCESVYSASKHALVGLTRSLSLELVSAGIRVNCICPPIVDTDMCAHYTRDDIEEFCRLHSARLYTPEQVASDIFDLAVSPDTGIILSEK